MKQITTAWQLVETDRALTQARELEHWLDDHGKHLPENLRAEAYATLANAAMNEARLKAKPGTAPDMSRASAFIQRARHVHEQ
jgi:hypothetical protein